MLASWPNTGLHLGTHHPHGAPPRRVACRGVSAGAPLGQPAAAGSLPPAGRPSMWRESGLPPCPRTLTPALLAFRPRAPLQELLWRRHQAGPQLQHHLHHLLHRQLLLLHPRLRSRRVSPAASLRCQTTGRRRRRGRRRSPCGLRCLSCTACHCKHAACLGRLPCLRHTLVGPPFFPMLARPAVQAHLRLRAAAG